MLNNNSLETGKPKFKMLFITLDCYHQGIRIHGERGTPNADCMLNDNSLAIGLHGEWGTPNATRKLGERGSSKTEMLFITLNCTVTTWQLGYTENGVLQMQLMC